MKDIAVLDIIERHKDHFDSRLIEMVHFYDLKDKRLEAVIFSLRIDIQSLKSKLSLAFSENKNLTKEIKLLSASSKKKDVIIRDLEKQFRDQIREIEESIRNVNNLQEQLKNEIEKSKKEQEGLRKKIKRMTNSNSTNSEKKQNGIAFDYAAL